MTISLLESSPWPAVSCGLQASSCDCLSTATILLTILASEFRSQIENKILSKICNQVISRFLIKNLLHFIGFWNVFKNVTYTMLWANSWGCRTFLCSALCLLLVYAGFIYSWMCFVIYAHKECVLSDNLQLNKKINFDYATKIKTNFEMSSFILAFYLNICLSFSQLPTKVPYWQLCTWSWRVIRKYSLNSNMYGYCCSTW